MDAEKDGFALVVEVDSGDEFRWRWPMVVVERGGVVGVEGREGVGEDGAVGVGKGFIIDPKKKKKNHSTG